MHLFKQSALKFTGRQEMDREPQLCTLILYQRILLV